MVDKVKVARHFTNNSAPNLGVLDLKEQIEKLAKYIRAVNGGEI